MMIFFCCTSISCDCVVRVHAPRTEEADLLIGPGSDWYPDRYPCPRCSEHMVFSTKLLEPGRVHDLTPHEAFICFSGAGLPEEGECSATFVHQLLTTKRIKDVQTRHVGGTNRCTLDHIEFEDGTKLYLGASTHGACVYRVQSPHSYMEGNGVRG